MDLVARELGANRIGQPRQRKFTGAVWREMRHGDLAADRRDINYASPTPNSHLRNDSGNQFVRRPKLQPHVTFKILTGHVFQWTDFNDDGVADQDVDLAKSIDTFLNC